MRRPGFDTRDISRMTGSPSTYLSSIRSSATPGRTCSRVKPRMYPSRFSTSSTLERILDAGDATTAWRALCPLRIRVSISPRGSLIVIEATLLPARLDHPRDLPRGGEFAQRDARHPELPVIAARAAGQGAAVTHAGLGAVARQLGEFQLCIKSLLRRRRPIDSNRFQPCPPSGVVLGELHPSGVFLDRALFGHLARLPKDQLANGISKPLRSALASASVFAVVTTTTSIPRVASTRS